MCESWWRMLLPASLSAGQAGAVGRSLCHALYNPLRSSRSGNHVWQGGAEAKATPGKYFKDGVAPCDLHPLTLGGRTSPLQSIHTRKPCPNQTLSVEMTTDQDTDPFPLRQLPLMGSQGMFSDLLAGKLSLLWPNREMPSPRHAWCASTTVNLLKEEENGLTNLWSLSLTSAADAAGGTCKPHGFIYLSVLILA